MKRTEKVFVFLFLFFSIIFIFLPKVNATELNTYSSASLLMDLNTGKVLYEKNIDQKMYPASTTKVMTAILVLENCNLDDVAIVSKNAATSITGGYVTANLKVDEELTIEQLLYVLMVGSSNDAAIVLAEHVSGSTENFAVLMNEKAKEIGCLSTNFVNPNGMHDENHYTTAHDLALIARYAMKNETFKELASTRVYRLPATNKYSRDDRLFSTTNDLINKNSSFYYKDATGVKTGFTTPAGNCLIASASKNNLNLLTVVLGAESSDNRYIDTKALFDYGFETYSMKQIISSGGVVHTVTVKNGSSDTKNLDAVVSEDINALIKKEDESSVILPEITLNNKLKAPIQKGEIIGSVKYVIEGVEYEANLIASHDVYVSMAFTYTLIVIGILLLILFMYYKLIKKNKRKNRLAKKSFFR